MKTSLILLGCLVGLSLQRGQKCEDGSKPTCEDGTAPQRGNGGPPCPEGRPKTCADGSEPSKDGYIDMSELRKMFALVGGLFSREEMEEFMAEADKVSSAE